MTKEMKMDKSKKLSEMVKKFFLEELNFDRRIETEWSTESFSLHIYSNDYDYNILTVQVKDGVPDFDYLRRATQLNSNVSNLRFHMANAEEIYIINLLKRYNSECLYIIDNELISAYSEDTLYFKGITDLHYNNELKLLECVENNDEKIVVDFINETIKFIE